MKINTVHGINKPWIEETSTEDLEYLNHLNIALGSCGEFHSCYASCKQAEQITADDYQRLDQLHYKVENALLKLIESLQKSKPIRSGKITFILSEDYAAHRNSYP